MERWTTHHFSEFKLDLYFTSKVKIKQLFTVFQRHLVTEKLMGIIHHFRPCMDWSDVTLFLTATLLLYIAPPPSRHDTQQIPVYRS